MLPIYNRDNTSETTKSESQNLKDQMKGFLGMENLRETVGVKPDMDLCGFRVRLDLDFLRCICDWSYSQVPN